MSCTSVIPARSQKRSSARRPRVWVRSLTGGRGTFSSTLDHYEDVPSHLADKIISVVTVTAPHRYAAVAVARAVVSDALKRQALPSSQSPDGPTQHPAQPAA